MPDVINDNFIIMVLLGIIGCLGYVIYTAKRNYKIQKRQYLIKKLSRKK